MKKYDTNVKITDFYVNWMKIKSACMTTINKAAGKEPNTAWKQKLLICRHSPIRRGIVSWKWRSIPYAMSTHFVRHHEGVEKFVGTEREDRTKVNREERSQMNPVPVEMDANLQGLINVSERRLCMCSDPTTRKYWEAVIEEIRKYSEVIAWSNVPQCVRCGGCVELFSECGFYKNLMKDATIEEQQDLVKRYNIYNKKVRNLVLTDQSK